IAKPACMNMTRKPVINIQVKLTLILFWPTWLATSPSVRPVLASPTGTSLTVPVSAPPGSPFASVAVVGALDKASFSSAADAEGGASARATIPAQAVNTTARVQIQDAMRAILMDSAPLWLISSEGIQGPGAQPFQIAFLFAAIGSTNNTPTREIASPMIEVVIRPGTLVVRWRPNRT